MRTTNKNLTDDKEVIREFVQMMVEKEDYNFIVYILLWPNLRCFDYLCKEYLIRKTKETTSIYVEHLKNVNKHFLIENNHLVALIAAAGEVKKEILIPPLQKNFLDI